MTPKIEPDWSNVVHEEERFWTWTHYFWCHAGRVGLRLDDLRSAEPRISLKQFFPAFLNLVAKSLSIFQGERSSTIQKKLPWRFEMKLNPFEIGKMIKKIIKNKDRYVERVNELKANPLQGTAGSVTATFDIEMNRISNIRCEAIEEKLLNEIRDAVNTAFDKADLWTEFEK